MRTGMVVVVVVVVVRVRMMGVRVGMHVGVLWVFVLLLRSDPIVMAALRLDGGCRVRRRRGWRRDFTTPTEVTRKDMGCRVHRLAGDIGVAVGEGSAAPAAVGAIAGAGGHGIPTRLRRVRGHFVARTLALQAAALLFAKQAFIAAGRGRHVLAGRRRVIEARRPIIGADIGGCSCDVSQGGARGDGGLGRGVGGQRRRRGLTHGKCWIGKEAC